MSFLAIYAFFIAPVLVVALGAAALWLHTWDLKRHDRQHPAE